MNLYLFNDADSAATYGIGTYIRELSSALKYSKVNIHIVHLYSVRQKFEKVITDQVENWYIPESRNNNSSLDVIQNMENYYRNVVYLLRIHIRETKNLIFHFNYIFNQFLAREVKAKFNCKTVATVHFTRWSIELEGNLYRFRLMKKKPEKQRDSFEQMLYKTYEYECNLFKEVDRVIIPTQYMHDVINSEYQIDPFKLFVIPNGLEDSLPLIADRVDFRKNWGIPENEFILLFVGRLRPVKGLVSLIKAFRILLEEFPNCHLMIAGNGDFDTHLQEAKGIYKKITFTGLLEKKELCELYQIADVGVVPSLFETFGYVAVEMMMHGLPVVVTATSGLNELVDESCGIKAYVTELHDRIEIDPAHLSQKITCLLQYPDEAKRLGKNARQRYVEKYTSNVFQKNMLDFYSTLY